MKSISYDSATKKFSGGHDTLMAAMEGGTAHIDPSACEAFQESMRKVYQDGRDFYDLKTGELIVSYPEMITNDYDVPGAERARRLFQKLHPSCVFATREELFG